MAQAYATMSGIARRTRGLFRLEYAVAVNIRAPASRIWTLLTDADDLPRWNSTVAAVDGAIARGETIRLRATIAPEREFRLTVSHLVPNQRMVWQDGMAPLFTGVRTFALTPQASGVTRFEMAEVYSGLMLPLIAAALPDFRPAFEQYAADLKGEAER